MTVGEVLLMEAASGVMLVMGGWRAVELGWGAVLGVPVAAMSLRPCMREAGTLILPAASLCSAHQQATSVEHEGEKASTSGNIAMVDPSATGIVKDHDPTSTQLFVFEGTQHLMSDSLRLFVFDWAEDTHRLDEAADQVEAEMRSNTDGGAHHMMHGLMPRGASSNGLGNQASAA